jgi:myo-inositol 2-dehydrogenase/D-chiro-inositol 1-dehydrogenase
VFSNESKWLAVDSFKLLTSLSDMFRYLQTNHFASLTEAIQHQSTPLDGIIISTPTPTHAPLINTAAANNISIFTEKPVDETSLQIQHTFNVVRNSNSNVALCCGFQRRFDPSYLALHDAIKNGAVGTPLSSSIFFGDHPVPSRSFLLQGYV